MNLATLLIGPILILIFTLQGCSTSHEQHTSLSAEKVFYQDSVACFRHSERKFDTQVLTGVAVTKIEIPAGYDHEMFGECMVMEGHPRPKADPKLYLKTARRCLQDAKLADDPEKAYAVCVTTTIDVDIVDKNDSRIIK